MAEFNLPDFSIGTETASDDIKKLLKIVKSDWDVKQIEIKTISGGFSCSTYHAFSKINPDDGLTIRVRKLFSQVSIAIVDPEFERKIVQIVSKIGLFSKVHAIFQNGYCYRYIKGEPLINWKDESTFGKTENEVPLKLMARKLAQIHCVKIDGEDFSKTDIFDKYLQIFEEKYPDEPDADLIDKSVVRKEFDEMIEYSRKMKLKVVLCHGDPHPGNMVWNKETEELTYVDWEVAHVGYQSSDIAYFFKFLETNAVPGFPKFLENQTENLKNDFIRFYLEEYCKINNSFEYSDELISEIERQVQFFLLLSPLLSLILCGSLKNNLITIDTPADFIKMLPVLFDGYQKTKDDVLRKIGLK